MVAKLPNADRAYINPRKLRDYALNPQHETGRFNAAFFAQMGYTTNKWQLLERDIREQLLPQSVEPGKESTFGQKYSITAALRGPSDQVRWVTVVWIIRPDQDFPEMVTIEPAQAR